MGTCKFSMALRHQSASTMQVINLALLFFLVDPFSCFPTKDNNPNGEGPPEEIPMMDNAEMLTTDYVQPEDNEEMLTTDYWQTEDNEEMLTTIYWQTEAPMRQY